MASIALNEVRKEYDGGVVALEGMSLDVADGEFVVFVGPSGCGKSTALKMIAGLEEVSGGQVMIGGRDVTDAARWPSWPTNVMPIWIASTASSFNRLNSRRGGLNHQPRHFRKSEPYCAPLESCRVKLRVRQTTSFRGGRAAVGSYRTAQSAPAVRY